MSRGEPVAIRRTKLEIIYDILSSVQAKQGRIKPTHLLYKSNLSHKKMVVYVQELISKGMLTEEEDLKHEGKRMYVLTDQGAKFLADFKRMKEFTESFGF